MRLACLIAILLAASPAVAQPDPVPPPPVDREGAVPEDVRRVLRALEAIAAAQAAVDSEAQRVTTSGSRLKREPGRGASSVRVSRGCASDLPVDGGCHQ